MAFDKAAIIKSVLDGQAEEFETGAKSAMRESAEHNGAEKVLHLLAQQMPSFADSIEKRIVADESMSPDTANTVRIYVRNIIARFQTMCEDNGRSQRHSQLRSEGQAALFLDLASKMRKKGDLELATARRRAEVAEDIEGAKETAEDIMSKITQKAVSSKKAVHDLLDVSDTKPEPAPEPEPEPEPTPEPKHTKKKPDRRNLRRG